MKIVVLYALMGLGVCLWALSALLRVDREGRFDNIRHVIGNKGTWRIIGLLALFAGLLWPGLLLVRGLAMILPRSWFVTKDDDDDDLPPPNQESPV